jgi:hypothetical protein
MMVFPILIKHALNVAVQRSQRKRLARLSACRRMEAESDRQSSVSKRRFTVSLPRTLFRLPNNPAAKVS